MRNLLLFLQLIIALTASAVDMYVIGENVNGKSWELADESSKMNEISPGIYEWTGAVLGTEFKFNNGGWSDQKYDIGADGISFLTLGNPYYYITGYGSFNIMYDGFKTVKNPIVTLNLNNGTILVEGEVSDDEYDPEKPEYPENMYIIGENVNGESWVLSQEDAKFNYLGDGVYEWTGEVLGSGFKINNGSWSDPEYNIGAGYDSFISINYPYHYYTGSGAADINLLDFTEINNPKVILNLKDKTITVQIIDPLYVIGSNVNGQNWVLGQEDAQFNYIGNGRYEWSGNVLGSSFKINDGTWDNNIYNMGSNGTPIYIDKEYFYVEGGNNINMPNDEVIYNPHIIVDVERRSILLEGEPNVLNESYIVCGTFNNWDINSEDAVMDKEDILYIKHHLFIPELSEGETGYFKIAKPYWIDSWGYGRNSDVECITQEKLSARLTRENANNQDMPYTISGIYDVIWNPETQIVTFKKITSDGILTVDLTEDATDGRYKNCIIELIENETGSVRRYVVTDRVTYAFNGLTTGKTYTVRLLSPAKVEIARISDFNMPVENATVTFTNILNLHTITTKVMTPDGKDVSDHVTIEWFTPLEDGSFNYTKIGQSIADIPEGQTLICKATLDSDLGIVYKNPEDVKITVDSKNTICEFQLIPFRHINLFGVVTDEDGIGVNRASVVASQVLNSKFSKTFTTLTDRQGAWSLNVYDSPEVQLLYSAQDYINVNDTVVFNNPDISSLDLEKIKMKSITGARINYYLTFKEADSEDIKSYDSDYQNVAIDIFNVTQNRAHNNVSIQYPLLVIADENVNPGDNLRVTASSKKGVFNTVDKLITLDSDRHAEVSFNLIGKGGITSTFEMTENPQVIALLYNDKGALLKKQMYSEAKVEFSNLDNGDYILVSMGQSDLMNSILRLSSLAEIGLTQDKDYIFNRVSVESGKISDIKIFEIPAFDESVFYYTNNSAGYSSNKSQITTGNYLTLRAAVDFKEAYKKEIKNVSLIIDLPDACDFVNQSVIQGSNILQYTLENNRITIPLGDKYQNQIRFCVIPTAGGTFLSTASIVFDYQGRTITQPIGSASSQIKDIDILVPDVISGKKFIVSGVAPGNSDVYVYYTKGSLIGVGKSNAKGNWSIECDLPHTYSNSKYDIYANLKISNGTILQTATEPTIYISDYPVLKTVTMHTDPKVIFDFENGTTSRDWYYTPWSELFTVNFSDNNPDIIKSVFLNVYGEDGSLRTFDCEYDKNKDLWFVNVDFNGYNSLTNLSVNYIAFTDYEYNSEEAESIAMDKQAALKEVEYENAEVKALLEYLESENITDDEEEECINQMLYLIDRNGNWEVDDPIPHELYDPKYDGGAVILYGEREVDQTPETKMFEKELESPYNTLFPSPDNNTSIKLESINGANSLTYVAPGDFNFESLLNSGVFSIPNANGDRLVYNSSLNPIDVDLDSRESIVVFENAIEDLICHYVENATSLSGELEAINNCLTLAMSTEKRYFMSNAKQYRALRGNSNKGAIKERLQLRQAMKRNHGIYKNAKLVGNTLGVVGIGLGVADVVSDHKSISGYFDEWNDIIDKIESNCTPNDAEQLICKAKKYRNDVVNRGNWKALGDGATTLLGVAGLAFAPETCGATLLLNVISAGCTMGLSHWEESYTRDNDRHIQEIIRECKKKKKCPTDPFPDQTPIPNPPYFPPLTINHDPSGYVYEAVPENRLEGVQASIYYRETKEDMYGDPYDDIILWNAEEYAQKNPLFTDENGFYQWDVPQGMWQVKFEKDGYNTVFSEWMPVPPPQLDVNIAMVQNKQPDVIMARAFEDGVEVKFDKYMDPATLTTENLFITANGESVSGEIILIDSALADEFESEDNVDATRYASRVRFVPETSLGITTNEVLLTVKRDVVSYAGLNMAETFSQMLDVEKEVQAIVAEDVKVLYGGEKEVTVYALPYEAAAGRTLHISASSDMIASLDLTETTLDENGKAILKVKGELPGHAQLSFSIDDVLTTGDCTVDVVNEIIMAETPKASLASGTAVYRGSKIELTTDSKDGVIYFTTDGSCPCDANGTRRKYTVPVVITENTKILGVTVVGDRDEDMSDIAEFNYSIKKNVMDISLTKGWNWISHSFETPIEASAILTANNVEQIVGQYSVTDKSEDDMLLTELAPAQSYKVFASANTHTGNLEEIAWSPATAVAVETGWNWLGYPLAQALPLSEAFDVYTADRHDMIIGQSGFSQYDGEKWIGTLDTLYPGEGYMYVSGAPKNLKFTRTLLYKVPQRLRAIQNEENLFTVDVHKYPSVMPVIAGLTDREGMAIENDVYSLYAFCGEECRGIGSVVDGMIMMSVYGEENEPITFRIDDENFTTVFPEDNLADSEITFGNKVLGSVSSPYIFRAKGDLTEVNEIEDRDSIKIHVIGNVLVIQGIEPGEIDSVEIYDTTGMRLLEQRNIPSTCTLNTNLNNGIYAVIIKGKQGIYSRKISLR